MFMFFFSCWFNTLLSLIGLLLRCDVIMVTICLDVFVDFFHFRAGIYVSTVSCLFDSLIIIFSYFMM